jgi:aryl-alcohol dehydrogenase-like predicted oxidoreductase
MLSRRDLLGMSFGAGASLALPPHLFGALRPSAKLELMRRAIPSSGEMLPVISFGARKGEPAALEEVLSTLVDHGGKVVDVLHGGPAGEQGARSAAAALGIQDRLFWTTPLSVTVPTLPGHSGPPPKPEPAAVQAALEEKLATFQVETIDLVLVGSNVHVPSHLAVLRELKEAGRVRYIGVHHLAFPPGAPMSPFGDLEAVLRNEPIDFIGTDYSVGDRRAEETILPLAQEKKVAVMAYFPFDRSRIFKRASGTPLPEWAAEFDAQTWAQFFLKYVLSHPAVTVARTGTTKAEHMLDNLGGGIGRLPDEALRKRMAELVDALPPTPPPKPVPPPQPPGQASQEPAVVLSAAVLDRYAGEYRHTAVGTLVTIRRDGDRLLVKSGTMQEGPLVARSETRFTAFWGATIDFQVDGQGKVTGAVVEQGPFRIPIERS